MSADSLINQAAQHSRFLVRQLTARPQLANEVAPYLERPLSAADMRAWLAQEILGEGNLNLRLRHLRSWVYAHLMARDLGGQASLAEVTETMTVLAEVVLDTCQRLLGDLLAARYGRPRNAAGDEIEMIVIGMGKLGGRELNVSSDIDLIFVYPEDGETDGARPISANEYFTRLGRAMIQAISEVTGDGFVFRVDMRLRPHGDSGPLVASFDMLENYLISQGREWERYAWIKARPLTGPQHEGLLAIARPFVFRKYLDFGSIDAMRALHAQIRREVARRDMADNIKLGPGGIREIEFIAQVFQLIRGGRDTELQVRPTCQVLDALAERGQLEADSVAQLKAAYQFLRRLEHRIQYLEDAQTHSMPATPEDRLRIAQSMDLADEAALWQALNAHREIVSHHFEAVFSDPTAGEHSLDAAWLNADDCQPLQDCLGSLNYSDTAALAERIHAFRQGARYRSMSNEGRSRLDALIPPVLALCAKQENSGETLKRVIDLLDAICLRASYLALLQQYPAALARMVEMAAASSWAADYLTRHPLLLDELLDSRNLGQAYDWPAFAAELRGQLAALGEDTEAQMDHMREAHHAQLFRLLTADLAGSLSVEHVSDNLSALADVMLEETLAQCWQKLPRRHSDTPRFAIIGYGKLGGKELGYASDLDIIFLYEDEPGASGPDAPEAAPIYARLAQRISNWLSSRTSSGQLFETDLRLRPNGDAGMLITSVDAFERYQQESAWTWEHQALTRARFCAGDAALGKKFEHIRRHILAQPRDAEKLRGEVIEMREKMLKAHANKHAGFQLKHDRGGLVDIEFLIQFLVLAHTAQYPALADNVGNIALLKRAGEIGLIPSEIATGAANAYRQLRRTQHALRLDLNGKEVVVKGMDEARAAVGAAWGAVFGVD